ncbi:hypothetical protein ANTRET_LOCUS5218 [Anthophora retusa]
MRIGADKRLGTESRTILSQRLAWSPLVDSFFRKLLTLPAPHMRETAKRPVIYICRHHKNRGSFHMGQLLYVLLIKIVTK